MIELSEDIFTEIYVLHVFYEQDNYHLLYNDEFVENLKYEIKLSSLGFNFCTTLSRASR